MRKILFIMGIFSVIGIMLSCMTGCESQTPQSGKILKITAGSESREIEPLIQEFARKNGCTINMTYKGSVDMMLDLELQDYPYDAVLAANSMWIRMGDADLHRVSDEASVMRSPVVLGLRKSVAEKLGWISKDVTVEDILNAVRQKELRFSMTSATQSNSGASAYTGLLFALAGKPEMLTSEHLADPELRARIKEIFGGMERSSGSSGWLNDMFLSKYDSLNSMFNYESMIIAANLALVKAGREPLYVIYPADGLAIADSTIGFVNRGDNGDKKELFMKLRDYLLSEKIQQEIFKRGFRTGLIGMNPENADRSIYNPDWGIDLKRVISPVPWPPADVIREAMRLYQTTLRKPSYTAYLLDVSGSMEGEGITQLKQAMRGLLDQKVADRYMLQTSSDDITVVIAFHNGIAGGWKVSGNNPEMLSRLMDSVDRLEPGGGTNIYLPIMKALEIFNQDRDSLSKYLLSVILMTDGMSNNGNIEEVKAYFNSMNPGFEFPPVFGVTFGEADERQLQDLALFSTGRVFDGKKEGLVKAFREAKGYN